MVWCASYDDWLHATFTYRSNSLCLANHEQGIPDMLWRPRSKTISIYNCLARLPQIKSFASRYQNNLKRLTFTLGIFETCAIKGVRSQSPKTAWQMSNSNFDLSYFCFNWMPFHSKWPTISESDVDFTHRPQAIENLDTTEHDRFL